MPLSLRTPSAIQRLRARAASSPFLACLALCIALVLTVGLQAPAVSVGVRWTPGPRSRTLDLIPVDLGEIAIAPENIRWDNSWLRWVLWGAAALALVALLVALVRVMRQRLRPTRMMTAVSLGADGGAGAEADARILTTGLVAALQILASERNPGNAVVRAWQGLEDAAAAAGLARRPAETASEFTARILYRSRRSAEPIAALLSLYQRVRFGEHVPTGADIAVAQTALTVLTELWRKDLPERRAPRGTH